ncbi:molybdopterin molybdotransferase MoeA [Flavonifractor sp. An306]|uniref:molybdopterin molybdotransferase MoeA n=1 Tax=Flavonifractor sp. An306 TaxID=1965629 RepID=UPI000B36E076|nr:molybdopterin molybdotransferase MoeA [Flavonifractor sp. An306]OUO41041.1 hypothetical protein B5F88_06780 [Flavonifractor sp. An306]
MKTGLTLEEAQTAILLNRVPLGTQMLPLERALGRTLAADVAAPLDQPPFDRSPLDGYALRSADLTGANREHPAVLEVVDTVYAGDEARIPVGPGQAVRLMTGAMLPPGCDCVVPQEDTDQGDPVSVFVSLKPFQNYVYQGEDYRKGALLLEKGTRLDAAALGVLASAGLTEVEVCRRPRVGLLTTGDEVVSPGTPLPAGKIYGSNQMLLAARLAELGFETETAHQGDNPAAVAEAMRELLETCDVLLTTGGVSVGDKDIFHQALPLMAAVYPGPVRTWTYHPAGGTLFRDARLSGGVQLPGGAAGGLSPGGGGHPGADSAAGMRRLSWNLFSIILTRRATPLWWM